MPAQQLQKLMIINKTKQLGWKIRLKSMFLTALTWAVWLSMAFMVYEYRQHIWDNPVLDAYYIGEVILIMFAIVFALIFCTICWSFLAKSKRKHH
ncbi:peptidylprolyl isomerase [Actinobacillus equuli subsp. equuli]|uniref:Biofilm PGA synthesis protein pgaD n=1 Tax=Actinobacillus equuli TaxID=718 RepID=A0AAX3FL48_ACTEU|nr:peptidylprolyl isomerase [Actinobacillus equuli]AIZ79699.1 peptidylprolyl isomerase [Actinobacillus equuli subsp. equuli]MDG4952933.1 peptidylprolyl isomerase [Actinobacillus equuli subsp. equuli]WGE43809.1 peptidylprolyl isomerase [Actinobacillus equuli subsp. equuli]WGE48062.1 peptidylprolyl isomerase [Actinobacillus equuli subsp. equuli]WGE54446.1 peptidylprolyl isomerase [Actinobacillus equuli subsp. equuli]